MEGDVSQSPGRNPGRRQAFWDQTAGFWGARRAGFLRGCITDRHFFLPDGMPPLKGETMERCHALMQWRPAPFVPVER